MNNEEMLNPEEHIRLHKLHKSHGLRVAETWRLFQMIKPNISYAQIRYWLEKPLVSEVLDIGIVGTDDFYFLGVLCAIKKTPISKPVTINQNVPLHITKYVYERHEGFCGEPLLDNKIKSVPLLALMNRAFKAFVLGTFRFENDDSDDDSKVSDQQIESFRKGYLYGSITNFNDDELRIPSNTHFLLETLEKLKPITFETKYNKHLFKSYSYAKILRYIQPKQEESY